MMFWRLLRLLRFVRRFRAFTVASAVTSTVTSHVVSNVTRDTARNVTHAVAHAVTSSVNHVTNTVSRIANSLFNLRKQVGGSLPRRLFVPAVSRLPPTHVHLPFVTGFSLRAYPQSASAAGIQPTPAASSQPVSAVSLPPSPAHTRFRNATLATISSTRPAVSTPTAIHAACCTLAPVLAGGAGGVCVLVMSVEVLSTSEMVV